MAPAEPSVQLSEWRALLVPQGWMLMHGNACVHHSSQHLQIYNYIAVYIWPAAAWMSTLIALTIALPMMRLRVSPIPIGLTPGHLSRATRRQATNADRLWGSTKQVHRHLAVTAIASHYRQVPGSKTYWYR